MIHYGDITKISGYDVPIVDCVVGGSPCQDLSVAGKRAGLDGERSGLFMEQIRITKEMRDKDERCNGRSGVNIRPRFFIWENVPGAFSSNKGEDFRIVLEEIAKIIDKDAVIPMPEKNKWTTSGAIVGDGWSIAWRILDAQFWGVPQRRRRITLIADFGGQCAQEILFVKDGLSGNSAKSREKGQGATKDAQGCFGIYDRDGERKCMSLHLLQDVITSDKISPCLSQGNSKSGQGSVGVCIALEPGAAQRLGGYVYEDVSGTLRANMGDNQKSVAYGFDQGATRDVGVLFLEEQSKPLANGSCPGHHNGVVICQSTTDVYEWHNQDSRISGPINVACTLNTNAGGREGHLVKTRCYDIGDRRSVANESVDVSPTLLSKMGTGGNNVPVVVEGLDVYNQTVTGDKSKALTSAATDSDHIPCIVMDRASYNQGENALYNIGIDKNGVAYSHIAKGPGAVCYVDTSHADDVVRVDDKVAPLQARDYKGGKLIAIEKKPRYIVRRLTPLECERLQGYPDFYTDIGEYIDSKGKKKKSSDSARYKALGNSIALPPWKWVIKRLCSHYERDATLCSLFDGIGGFPLIWEQINGKGSCLWASEIEDFPIAVTKKRIE